MGHLLVLSGLIPKSESQLAVGWRVGVTVSLTVTGEPGHIPMSVEGSKSSKASFLV